MRMNTRTAVVLLLGVVLFGARLSAHSQDGAAHGTTVNHPAVGSYFAKSVQLCVTGAPCPQIALFMTPTIMGDGNFIGNDSLTLGGAPFGPHTTAHGQWKPISKTTFIADYTFMLPPPLPPGSPDVSALRFRWLANVTDTNTIVGYVNIYLFPPIPVGWQSLAADQPGVPFSGGFPDIPSAADGIVTAPTGVVIDPNACPDPSTGCPLVFKFTAKRVAP